MGSTGFASGLAFAQFAVDELAGFVDVALLGDAGGVEHAVDPSVSTEVESMLDRLASALSGGQGDGAGAAPAGEFGLASEAVRRHRRRRRVSPRRLVRFLAPRASVEHKVCRSGLNAYPIPFDPDPEREHQSEALTCWARDARRAVVKWAGPSRSVVTGHSERSVESRCQPGRVARFPLRATLPVALRLAAAPSQHSGTPTRRG